MDRTTAFSSLRQEKCLHVDGVQMDRQVSELYEIVFASGTVGPLSLECQMKNVFVSTKLPLLLHRS